MIADTSPHIICNVISVHDGDGPLWCRSGEKVRVAGIQAPDFESAEPCRRPAAHRVAYLARAAATVGTDRLLFSTDYPYQYREGGDARRFLTECGLDDLDKAAFAHRNWYRLTGAKEV